ncbi:MAG TPA: FoF1 ATP synthase subunit gamma [Steroidobacteraceae bacterium]|nr:FoF1 ATP synthase subunit gamma [Steroidobacteraceae bacterium]
MTRLAEIQGRIASMDELLDIVGAMRSLAGMRVQEAQHALPGIRRYAAIVASAIATALLLTPTPVLDAGAGGRRRALVLFTAEHGFVGAFNERLLAASETAREAGDLSFVVGSRGAALALERGRRIEWTSAMATRPTGTFEIVDPLVAALYGYIGRGEISRIEIMFARYRQGSGTSVEQRLILPLEQPPSGASPAHPRSASRLRQPPLHNLEPQALLEKLVAEYVFALLTEAAVESIASENAARFAAMESAHENVSKKLDELRRLSRQERQTEITSELLDLITGTEAVAERPSGADRGSRGADHAS